MILLDNLNIKQSLCLFISINIIIASFPPGSLQSSVYLAPPRVENSFISSALTDIYGTYMPAPLFPRDFDKVEGQWTPRWLYLQVMTHIFIEQCEEKKEISFNNLKKISLKRMQDYGHALFSKESFSAYFYDSLEYLVSIGLLSFTKDGYTAAAPLRVLALWSKDVKYIQKDLRNEVIEKDNLSILYEYNAYATMQYLYPVQSFYPVEIAVSLLAPEEQTILKQKILGQGDAFSSLPLVNAILLMLSEEKDLSYWVKQNTPDLDGVRIYEATAEASLRVGGLGSVIQFDTDALSQMGADVIILEPRYRTQKNPANPGEWIESNDYSTVPFPVFLTDETQDVSMEFIGIHGKLKAHHGMNVHNIKTILFEDSPDAISLSYFYRIYEYDDENKHRPSRLRFSAFLAKAMWNFVRERERALYKEQKDSWKPPIINSNDMQTLLIPVFRLIDYWDAVKRGDTEEAKFLTRIMTSATTHTYGNRGVLGEYNELLAEELELCGIPRSVHWLLLREIAGKMMVDISSAGLRAANVAKAVSSIQAKEVAFHDPGVTIFGTTNGDNLLASSKYFRHFLNPEIKEDDISADPSFTLKATSPEDINTGGIDLFKATPQQVLEAKRKAKKIIGLNPDQIVISYSGRWVYEKWCNRALTKESILKLVELRTQVVVYATVFGDNDRGFTQLQKDIKRMNLGGRFIFKKGFTPDEQVQLLAATDVQIQDSDRSTEGSGSTESNSTINGALSMGPPWQEGIINDHGIQLNFEVPGWGNSIVPENDKPESYLKQLKKVITMDWDTLAEYQASSIRISRILTARNTVAADMRLWNAYYQIYTDLPIPRPWSKDNPRQHRESEFYSVEVRQLTVDDEGDTGQSLTPESNTFNVGDPLRVYVKVNPFDHSPDDVKAYLVHPDGTKDQMTLQVHTKDTFVYALDLPTHMTGEFYIMITSGVRAKFYMHPIRIQSVRKKGYTVTRKQKDNKIYITFRFPPWYGHFLHIGFAGKGWNAWEHYPDRVSVLNAAAKSSGNKDPLGAKDFIMEEIQDNGSGYTVTVVIENPDVTHLVFVTADTYGRWHDASKGAYWVPVRSIKIRPSVPLSMHQPAGEIPQSL